MTPDDLPGISERRFQAQIVQLARLCGWLVYHTHDSRRSAAGFPDLVLCRAGPLFEGGELLFAELKTDRGKLTRGQEIWLAALRAAGLRAVLWRPSMWKEIEQCLQ